MVVGALEALAAIADEAGAPTIAREARDIADRTAAGRFYVACVGQCKRGKSTLLNALVGDAVLPAGILPVTTVPTILRYGPLRSARVRVRGEAWREIDVADLEVYVSETQNPENARGVDILEVFLPSPILEGGLCLVDTPGVGSVFAGNTAAAKQCVPHIDVALVVIGSEPPLGGDELALVEALARHVHEFIVVFAKADRATDAERAAAGAFARQLLASRLGRSVDRIFEVSALERLTSTRLTRDWDALVGTIRDLARRSGRILSGAARERAFTRLSERLTALLEADRQAVARPVAEASRHVAALAELTIEAERALGDLDAQFLHEQRQITRGLAARRDRFLAETAPNAQQELARTLASTTRRFGPAARREAMDAALGVARRHLLPWLETERLLAEDEYRRAARRFVAMANAFLDRLAASGKAELCHLPNAIDAEHAFRSRSHFSFLDLLWIAHPASPLRYLLDVALGAAGFTRILHRDAHAFLRRALETNAERVQNDLEDQLSESRRRLEADIRLLLRDVRVLTEHSFHLAQRSQRQGESAVRDTLTHLARQIDAIRALGAPAGTAPVPRDE